MELEKYSSSSRTTSHPASKCEPLSVIVQTQNSQAWRPGGCQQLSTVGMLGLRQQLAGKRPFAHSEPMTCIAKIKAEIEDHTPDGITKSKPN